MRVYNTGHLKTFFGRGAWATAVSIHGSVRAHPLHVRAHPQTGGYVCTSPAAWCDLAPDDDESTDGCAGTPEFCDQSADTCWSRWTIESSDARSYAIPWSHYVGTVTLSTCSTRPWCPRFASAIITISPRRRSVFKVRREQFLRVYSVAPC